MEVIITHLKNLCVKRNKIKHDIVFILLLPLPL